jgi:hypothetical protein
VQILLGVAIAASAQADNEFHQAWQDGQASGQIRLGYISQDADVAATSTTDATAIGGQFKYETAEWKRLQFGLAAYLSKKLHSLSGDAAQGELNSDFFDKDSKSFAYIGEAYLNMDFDDFNVRAGRQLLDTPYVNTDDIRMLPNTFEGAYGSYTGLDNTTLFGGYISQWAGADSATAAEGQDEFKDMAGTNGDGTAVAGLLYEGFENLAVQGWVYDIDNMTQLFYADATYGMEGGEDYAFEFGVQFATFDEEGASATDGNAYGISAAVSRTNMTLSIAYNKTSNDAGDSVTNGFGGGPYFTSMDEMTIGDLSDAEAYIIGAEFDLSERVVDGLGVSVAHGHFEDEGRATTDTDELDIVVSYALGDHLDAELIYANVDNDAAPNDADTNFDRYLLRINYNF